MYSWYTFATKIFEEFNFDFTEYENFNILSYKIKNNLKKKFIEVVFYIGQFLFPRNDHSHEI
jgi:hypothetical protein